MELDDLDAGLLRLLQADARQSFRQLAKALHTTTPTVSARVKQLEALGLIQGYHARIDPGVLGGRLNWITLQVRPNRIQGVAEALAQQDWAQDTFVLSGGIVAALVRLREPVTARVVHDAISQWDGVERYEMHEVLRQNGKQAPVPAGLIALPCHHCGRTILGEAVTARFGKRQHAFCCDMCRQAFGKRFESLVAQRLTNGKGKP